MLDLCDEDLRYIADLDDDDFDPTAPPPPPPWWHDKTLFPPIPWYRHEGSRIVGIIDGEIVEVHDLDPVTTVTMPETVTKPRRGAREPRDEQQISQVRGVIAQRVVVSIPLDPFLSLKALAAYSSISRSTLKEFINLPPTEAPPCYRLPGKILVRRSEFDAWIERARSRGRPSVERAMRELGLPLTP
jgi:hypothetical protein